MMRRRGITLLETLAAIFITGIGLLSLLTLFPAGAVKMAEAVKDDRTGHIKENAHGIADVLGVRGNTVDRTTGVALRDDQNPDPVVAKYLKPGGGLPDLLVGTTYQTFNGRAPSSYPVLVDPNGHHANSSNVLWQNWVGGAQGLLPRTVPAPLLFPDPSNINPDRRFVDPANGSYRIRQRLGLTVFLDDMRFQRESDNDNPNGPVYTGWPVANPPSPTNPSPIVDRTPRWSWAWMVQRPAANDPRLVELTVIAYKDRDLTTAGFGEQVFDGNFSKTGKVTITWPAGQTPPDLKSGGWILDVRPAPPTSRAKFHRITNITDTTDPTTGAPALELEIQGGVLDGPGKVFILDNVVEVFERGIL